MSYKNNLKERGAFMKKKIFGLLILIMITVTLTGCLGNKKKNENGKAFKEDYEEINGETNKSGKTHRTITLSENNKFIETEPSEIVNMIKSGETFYIYFGSRLCPWCRSVIEKADEVSRLNDIDKVYYVDIWDDEGNEILRDKYELNENNELVKTINGTEEYEFFLKEFDEYLRDYSITDKEGNSIPTGEKRIYAPNFILVEKGKIKKLVTGKSELQKDSREELTSEMLKDEEEVFNKFFENSCDDGC